MTHGHVMTAKTFAEALAKGDFDGAHTLLSADAKLIFPPTELENRYRRMTEYGTGPAADVQVIQELASWPDRQPDDVGWAYVAISGATFSEAVTVIVSRENGEDVIRSIEWGRP